MVTKAPKNAKNNKTTTSTAADSAPLAQTVKDSAQQFWTAGKEALSKAQKLQKKAQSAAEDRIEALSSKAGEQWDKLESLFEERVAKALKRLGVPTQADIDALNRRIDALSKKPAAAKPVVKKAVAAPAKKVVAKKAAPAAKKAPVARKKVPTA